MAIAVRLSLDFTVHPFLFRGLKTIKTGPERADVMPAHVLRFSAADVVPFGILRFAVNEPRKFLLREVFHHIEKQM